MDEVIYSVLYLRTTVKKQFTYVDTNKMYYLLIFLTDLRQIKDGQMIKMGLKWYTVKGIVMTTKSLMPSAAGIVRSSNINVL